MQLHQLILLAAVTLPACEVPSVSSRDRADVSADVSVGKFADAKLSDLEARAKAAGWKVMASEFDGDAPVPTMALELDDGSHFAYVTLFDFVRTKSVASKLGSHTALTVAVGDRDPDKLLSQLIGKSALDELNRDSLRTSCESLGYKVMHIEVLEEDGITFVTMSAESKDESTIELFFVDFAAAKNEGRIGVDGHRIMNVFVCKDCTKRNTRILSQAWQTAKAKVLLGRLTQR